MKNYNEAHTIAVLSGIPIFCVNRIYVNHPTNITSPIGRRNHYRFELDNGYKVSVVEFVDRRFSGGHQYEALMSKNSLFEDVERGNEHHIHDVLCQIERLGSLEMKNPMLAINYSDNLDEK